MADVRTRIANAHMNLPQLKRPNKDDFKEELVILGVSNTILDKLSKHRANEPVVEKKEEEAFKWRRIKEQMIVDMEKNRDEEWKKQILDEKLNNEEEEEMLGDDDDILSDEEEEKMLGDDDGILSDEEEEIKDHANSPFPFPSLDTQDDQGVFAHGSEQICISQNLPLTPLVSRTQTDRSRSPSNSSLFETDGFHFGSDNFGDDDSQLADMCSGKFGPATMSSSKSSAKKLFAEDEAESEAEDDAGDYDDNDNNKANIEDDIDDGEEEDEEEDEEEETIVINRSQKKYRVSDFFENEAELSGSDGEVSSDEDENEDDEEGDEEDDFQEDLPSDDELRDQVGKMHNKALLDEDKRQLMIMKEMFFDDGDLHDDDDDRKKKFKWNLNNADLDDQFANVLSDSSDDDDDNSQALDGDFGDSNPNRVIRLKKETATETVQTASGAILTTTIEAVVDEATSSSTASPKKAATPAKSALAKKGSPFTSPKTTLRPTLKKKTNTKISSFFFKDERLKSILTKRPNNNSEMGNNNSKRQKTAEAKSIFDVL